ncbi:hypothetical protein AK812_SmicGene30141 [Symbiodinium microadriaticum]|uniref:Uncharacterized protein n=1 Tax=Symbiodinium microadriaticum TaxID=2951 RepID=A0A1Q9D027_SYMMI|nr:hypothetical protein AK812_SmicGene30141 [Symbiodinium microadriaticum]
MGLGVRLMLRMSTVVRMMPSILALPRIVRCIALLDFVLPQWPSKGIERNIRPAYMNGGWDTMRIWACISAKTWARAECSQDHKNLIVKSSTGTGNRQPSSCGCSHNFGSATGRVTRLCTQAEASIRYYLGDQASHIIDDVTAAYTTQTHKFTADGSGSTWKTNAPGRAGKFSFQQALKGLRIMMISAKASPETVPKGSTKSVTRTVFVHGGSDGKGKLVLLDGLFAGESAGGCTGVKTISAQREDSVFWSSCGEPFSQVWDLKASNQAPGNIQISVGRLSAFRLQIRVQLGLVHRARAASGADAAACVDPVARLILPSSI